MAKNYLDIIGDYYPTASAHVNAGDSPDVYTDIVWDSTSISQAELDYVKLIDVKTEKIIAFSELAREEIVVGFTSSALGTPHTYDSEPEDQLNLIGSVATSVDMYYSCRAYTQGNQTVDIGGAATGTESTGFNNDTTQYAASIEIDGTGVAVSFAGQDAQTINDLITALNGDTNFSVVALAELSGGNIKLSSLTYGSASTVNIVDTNLFSSLTLYVGLLTAINGVDGKDNIKNYEFHTHTQLLQVLNDGKDVKLAVLQYFNTKRTEIENAPDIATVDAITWNYV